MSSGRLLATAFGVGVDLRWRDLTTDEDHTALLATALPPGAMRGAPDERVIVDVTRDDAGWRIAGSSGRHRSDAHLVHALERVICAPVALRAPGLVFVHAGVVGTASGAVLLPGRSFSGKTTLVSALIERGATYLSDEYAVLTPAGRVLPYRRRLSLRVDDQRIDVSPPDDVVPESMPVSAVLSLRYIDGSPFDVNPLDAGETMMHLVANAVAARTRASEVMRACAAVARRASGWAGFRPDATSASVDVLRLLGSDAAT